MTKKYLKLTKEQRERGVIFSSTLLPDDNPTIHEVFEKDSDRSETINNLKNDRFFDNMHWKYNEIRK